MNEKKETDFNETSFVFSLSLVSSLLNVKVMELMIRAILILIQSLLDVIVLLDERLVSMDQLNEQNWRIVFRLIPAMYVDQYLPIYVLSLSLLFSHQRNDRKIACRNS